MIRKHSLLQFLAGAVMLAALPSCINDDDTSGINLPTALVTVCPDEDGTFVMHLDNTTRLVPTNLASSPFGKKEVRALVNYTETEEYKDDDKIRNVKVNWLDSIRTKLPVESAGDRNDEMFGKDPIEIVRDWVTVAEDGYITLRVRTLWGIQNTRHAINLLTGVNESDPYELEIRHDAKGDIHGEWGDALVAFNLNGLAGELGDVAKIKLKWMSFSGEKSVEFDLKMRPLKQDVDASSILHSKAVE